MKKRLLFVIESLVCAGAEKSLVALLSQIDYSQYDVDLQLFSRGGEFEPLVPKDVNILPELPYFEFTKQSLGKSLLSGYFKFVFARLMYSLRLRLGKFNNPQRAVLFWKSVGGCFEKSNKHYDVAIAYAQCTPTYYVAEKVEADKKFAWVNSIFNPKGKFQEFNAKRYVAFDKIVCVSEDGKKVFAGNIPEVADKCTVIGDINDGKMMQRMVELDDVSERIKKGKVKLLTIGRLAAQKGYDLAIEACKILREKGIDFCWYALGRGPLEGELRSMIAKYGLKDHFVLLGATPNPYPYIKESDIYVQTSRHEGFGMAIAEARILNTPVVTTRFDAVYAQMVEGENGLVCDMNPEAIAESIEKLMNDSDLYNHIVEYLKTEEKGNYGEYDKFIQLINEK